MVERNDKNKFSKDLNSPLLTKYLDQYEKEPTSKVFAPLAEHFRKLGLYDRALAVLKNGIKYHPTYVIGYVGLASCYFDLEEFTMAYTTLRPLVATNRDNIRLQELFAETSLRLNKIEEALETYKFLLFLNPKNSKVAEKVRELENMKIIPEKEFFSTTYNCNDGHGYMAEQASHSENGFAVDALEALPNFEILDSDDWVAVDLTKKNDDLLKQTDSASSEVLCEGEPKEISAVEDCSEWQVSSFDNPIVTNPPLEFEKEIAVEEKVISETVQEESSVVIDKSEVEQSDNSDEYRGPIITHTLVNIYCEQGHYQKALDILDKILITNPRDVKTIEKIEEVKALINKSEQKVSGKTAKQKSKPKATESTETATAKTVNPSVVQITKTSENSGSNNLMDYYDAKFGEELFGDIDNSNTIRPNEAVPISKTSLVEKRLSMFLNVIKKEAAYHRNQSNSNS